MSKKNDVLRYVEEQMAKAFQPRPKKQPLDEETRTDLEKGLGKMIEEGDYAVVKLNFDKT